MPLRELLEARAGARTGALRASILEHLQDMCATRRGTVEGRPDYGLPDLSEMVHSFPRAISDMREALQHTIETYEPRLTHVRVTHLAGQSLDLILRYEISATLAEDLGGGPMRFETRVDAARGVRIE